jgi:3-oxoacyl-[acyl-carrier-protein] synthase II
MDSKRDKAGRPIVVVTGMGLVTPLGVGKIDNWAKLTSGESGIRKISRFSTEGLKTTIAGTVDFAPSAMPTSTDLAEWMADQAAEEAIAQAGIGAKADFPGPLFVGAAPVELEWPQRDEIARVIGGGEPIDYDAVLRVSSEQQFAPYHDRFLFGSIADHLSEKFGTKGSPITITTACASGVSAIQLGVEAIRRGEADAALCVATDASVNPEALIRFSLLSALSTHNDQPAGASKPFSKNRDGFVMAEGAGAMVIESLESALARGVRILGVVAGCGELSDSFHRTRSSPDGKPIIGCMRNALADAGMEPGEIDYINAHGTSTPVGDEIELNAVQRLVGEDAGRISMSSTKSSIGHLLGAAGAVEAIFSILAMRDRVAPPTINLDNPSVNARVDLVPHKAHGREIDVVLSNSFGFGGTNASLVFRRLHD